MLVAADSCSLLASWCAATTLALAALATGQQEPAPQPARAPNILLVFADDLGYGELGCYGQKRIETPNLDRLAAGGMRFTQFYAGAPVCAPSRDVLFTGRHTGHATVRDNRENKDANGKSAEGQFPLPGGMQTLGTVLQAAGYDTACMGKWGLGGPGSTGVPDQQGIATFFGYLCQREAHSFYPRKLWSNHSEVPLPANADKQARERTYACDVILEEGRKFLRKERKQPFFLAWTTTLPHLALQVPDRELERYRGRFEETPYTGGKGYTPHPTPRAAYAAMITRLDWEVGQLLAEVEARGQLADTLVVVTSDNGPTHDVGGVDTAFFASAGPLRGRKGSVWEGGIRVPMIASWPGAVPAGTVSNRIAGAVDLLPTLAEFAGARLEQPVDGITFAPTLRGRDAETKDRVLVWHFNGYGGQQAVREGNLKGVRTGLHKDPGAPLQLFDLAEDLAEQRDLAGERPEVAKRMRELLDRSFTPSPDFPFPALDGTKPTKKAAGKRGD